MFDRMDTDKRERRRKHDLSEKKRRATIVKNEEEIRIILKSFDTSRHALYFHAAREIYRLSGMAAPEPDPGLITESVPYRIYQQKIKIACLYLKNALINTHTPFPQIKSTTKTLCATKNMLYLLSNKKMREKTPASAPATKNNSDNANISTRSHLFQPLIYSPSFFTKPLIEDEKYNDPLLEMMEKFYAQQYRN